MKSLSLLMSTILSICWAIQITLMAAFILASFSAKSILSAHVFEEVLFLIRPEWETVLYRLFIASACMGAAGIYFSKRVIKMNYFIVECLLTLWLLVAGFKIIVYAKHPDLAQFLFFVGIIISIAYKIFPSEAHDFCKKIMASLEYYRSQTQWRLLTAIGLVLLIMIWIYIPDTKAALARMFVGEQMHHNDSFIFGPGFAVNTGLKLNLDVISQYGVGMPVIIAGLTKIFGGFNYESAFKVMVWMVMIYYAGWFLLLRRWFKSGLLAFACLVWGIKLQMFNAGVYPFAFTYGSATPLRFFFDLFFFASVLQYVQRKHIIGLVCAGIIVGVQLFYIMSEGVYLLLSFWALCLINGIIHWQFKKNWFSSLRTTVLLMITPLAVTLALFFCIYGFDLFQVTLWQNMGEFINYFLSGFGVTPIYSGLLEKKYLASLMGFIIPSVYVIALLFTTTTWFIKRHNDDYIMVIILCVYGLGLYHYYVARSAANSYYVVSLPYVFIMGFFIKEWLSQFNEHIALRIKLILLVVVLIAFGSTHMVMAYPNIFNWSKNPYTDPNLVMPLENGGSYFNHLFRDYNDQLKVPVNSLGQTDENLVKESDFKDDRDLKNYFDQEFDFSEDAKLIGNLTQPNSQVLVISSFEIRILMQAKRKPWAYYFPLIISQPMSMRSFARSSIYTKGQLEKVFHKLETTKPEYVFIERKYLTRPVNENFYFYYSSFMYLTDYVLKYYEPAAQGKYLTALKRMPL